MNQIFSAQDNTFMNIALDEAIIALDRGDFPVGATLVIDKKIIDRCSNESFSNDNWVSRAESILFYRNSALIKRNNDLGSKIELFVTLEPCLMCFSTAIHHRLSRIIYASPDPNAGSTHLNPKEMKIMYRGIWPNIQGGLLKEQSCDLMINFFSSEKHTEWKEKNAKLFQDLKKTW